MLLGSVLDNDSLLWVGCGACLYFIGRDVRSALNEMDQVSRSVPRSVEKDSPHTEIEKCKHFIPVSIELMIG